MNRILARELAIQMRAGAMLDDVFDFAVKTQQTKGGGAEQETFNMSAGGPAPDRRSSATIRRISQ